VAGRLSRRGIDGGAPFWEGGEAEPRARFSDVGDDPLRTLVKRPNRAGHRGRRAFIAKAARLLPPEPWDETTWISWTKAVSAALGSRGGTSIIRCAWH